MGDEYLEHNECILYCETVRAALAGESSREDHVFVRLSVQYQYGWLGVRGEVGANAVSNAEMDMFAWRNAEKLLKL